MNSQVSPPEALMLLAPSCAYCPAVLQSLGELIKKGTIGRLEVVNIAAHPSIAERYGVRSVPWVRIGEFELSGTRSHAELERWSQRVGTQQGMADYAAEQLKSGGLVKVLGLVAANENYLDALLVLLADAGTDLHVRIGIGAVFEHVQGSSALQSRVDALGVLTQHADIRVRSDAAHYLSFTRSSKALPYLEKLLGDPDAQVREIAEESIETTRAG